MELVKKVFLAIGLLLLLAGVLLWMLGTWSFRARGPFVYIRADGSIDPSTAPISTVDRIAYIMTGNTINISIVVQRDNILLDGHGHSIQGQFLDYGDGIRLISVNNVTITNTSIAGFENGISLDSTSNSTVFSNNVGRNLIGICLNSSSHNMLSDNNITQSNSGVFFTSSSNNTVSGNNIYGNVLLVSSSYNIVSDNTVAAGIFGGMVTYPCIYLNSSSHNTVFGNNITGGGRGVELDSSSNNVVSANSVTGAIYGIYLDYSSYNALSGNIVSNSSYSSETEGSRGIYLDNSCSYDNVSGNSMVGIVGFEATGITVGLSCSNNTVSYNSVTGSDNGIYVGSSSSYNTVSGNNIVFNSNLGDSHVGILLIMCSYNTVSYNIVNGTGTLFANGINLASSSDNTVLGNKVIGNSNGIGISGEYNTISENNATGNVIGIGLSGSSNVIYHNNFIDSVTQQVYSSGEPDSWDAGYPSGGNYWSNYNGTDAYRGPYQNVTGSDGIGDTPYFIDGNNTDHYPLMQPWDAPAHS